MELIKDFNSFAKSNGVSPLVLDDYRRSQGYINPTIIEDRPSSRNLVVMDVFSKLLLDNIIFLGDAFNDDMANVIVSQLLWLQATKPGEEIKMYINSPGGWVSSGLAIKDTMDFVQNDISTVCVGQAASMGAFILANGTKGKRYSMPHSKILFHNLSAGTQGNISDIRIAVEEMERTNDELQKIVAENTGRSLDEVAKALDRDNWMTPEEALEFGAIDKIIRRK
jgi:ATP-dependent Clp protease protease subunit